MVCTQNEIRHDF